MVSVPRQFAMGLLFLGSIAALSFGPACRADELVQLSVEGTGSDRLLTIEAFDRDGVRYVPLRALIESCGGAFSVLPTRARVDLFGSTAWLREGESRVHALSIFSLSHNILKDGDNLLIAIDDLPDFFQKSFRKEIRVVGGGSIETASPAQPQAASIAPVNSAPSMEGERGGPPRTESGSRTLPPLEIMTPAAPAGPREYRTLVIDIGHGGYDAGAQSGDDLTEDALALAIAKQVKARLLAAGPLQVSLSREEDVDLSENQRLASVNAPRPDFVVSLHVGTSPSPQVEGVAAFYPPPLTFSSGGIVSATLGGSLSNDSRRLALAVGDAVARATGASLRGTVQAPLRVLNDLTMPSALIEVGCITNPEKARKLSDGAYQGQIADGVAAGILAFVAPDGAAADGAQNAESAEN